MLIEVDGCVYDEQSFKTSHGYERMDEIGREAFVNHIHINGDDRHAQVKSMIDHWTREMKVKWPDRAFRIYRQVEPDEISIRFHMVREDLPDWCDSGLDIIEVNP